MLRETLVNVLGSIMIVTGIFDAIKYRWEAQKIRSVGTATGHSRKFINMALGNDIIRVAYAVIKPDWYILAVSILAVVYMLDLFFAIYMYYPYKNRHKVGFKRPGLHIYLLNSFLPNTIRKKL